MFSVVLSLLVLLLYFSCKWSTRIPRVLLSSSPDCWPFGVVAGVWPSAFLQILSPFKALLQAVSLFLLCCASFLSGRNCQGQVPLVAFLILMGICLFAFLILMGVCLFASLGLMDACLLVAVLWQYVPLIPRMTFSGCNLLVLSPAS